ncbi:hypothetical protein GTU73_08915 [Rathayibacter sp. VKM Ac-2804]|uniref:hypothetical protein n=1 Tax=Rathayibacter sp. VKM Ac-2804 TaxID=2609257 RepID=UPI00132F0977|nr:hypothetical protein [Rathayibacter sp. VKM Ac-2804]QHF24119.1 hypothetical protein GTU73_08915 [Rathayibacter sp. VKM Ac-2804]
MSTTSRQRTLKAEIVFDELIEELPPAVRLFALLLHWQADDEGRASSKASKLKADLYLEDATTSESDIESMLLQLAEIEYLYLYSAMGREYLLLREVSTIQRATPSRLPGPPEDLASASRAARERLMAEGGGGARGAQGEPGGVPLLDLPSPFCVVHQPAGPGRGVNCRDCGDARQYHQQLARERRSAAATAGPRFEPED